MTVVLPANEPCEPDGYDSKNKINNTGNNIFA